MSQESVLTKIPTNTSFLQPTKFIFAFPTLPFLKYFCQSAELPAVSTGPVPVNTPFVTTYRHGDTLQYDSFDITAIVDEDLRVWEESYNWLRSLTKPTEFPEYVRYYNEKNTPYHDAILTLNTNANLSNIRILFKDCHPVSLSNIQFDTKSNADNAIVMDVSFRYDYYVIERF